MRESRDGLGPDFASVLLFEAGDEGRGEAPIELCGYRVRSMRGG